MQNADCRDCILNIQSYVDNELDAVATAKVLSHVTTCKECAAQLKEAESLSRALRHNLTRY